MQQQEQELEYAGFWVRVGASLLDTILLLMITVPLVWVLFGRQYFTHEVGVGSTVDNLITWVLPAVLVMVFWLLRSSTPGKMAIDAVIVDARTGAKPTTLQFVIRYIGYYVAGIPLFIGLIWVAFDRRKQGWHDKMAGTVVVRRRGGAHQPVHFEQPQQPQPPRRD